jgi:type VI secretion system secreted protein VgrG
MSYHLKIEGTGAAFRVTHVEGRERVHVPSMFRVTCVPEDGAELDPEALLTKDAHLSWVVREGDGPARTVHGVIDGVEVDGPLLRLTIVPPIALLADAVDHQVFTDLTALDIIERVLAEHGITAVTRVRRSLPKRAQCVQAFESDLAFISRLCAEEGIVWYLPLDGQDEIVLSDNPSGHEAIEGELPVREEAGFVADEAVTSASVHHRAVSGKVALRDYDFEKPQLDLSVADATAGSALELYQYPGGYTDPAVGRELAKVRLRQARSREVVLTAATSCRRLAPGYVVAVSDPNRDGVSGRWLLIEVQQEASVNGASDAEGSAYRARIVAVPAHRGYLPPCSTMPTVGGVQTATVTGPPGREIHPDAYGRVKVQLRSDRRWSKDDTSSTFVRVVQPPTSGAFLLPRVGWEVLVGFQGTSADAPIVLGRLSNGTAPPPHSLPTNKVVSAFGTATTPGGGSGNLVAMNDAAGHEGMTFSASGDYNERTENDKNTTVTASDTWTIGAARTLIVGQVLSLKVDGAQTYSVGGSRTVNVTANKLVNAASETVVIGGLRAFTVGGDYKTSSASLARLVGGAKSELGIEHSDRAVQGVSTVLVGGTWSTVAGVSASLSVLGASTELVAGPKTITASRVNLSVKGLLKETLASRTVSAGANREEGFGGAGSYAIGGAATIKGSDVSVKASDKLTIKAGGVTITMTPSSITIRGDVKSSVECADEGTVSYG